MSIFIAIQVFPYIVVIILLLLILMFKIKGYSIIGIIDSLRFDAITRSPINSMFSTSLNGLTTIRAY